MGNINKKTLIITIFLSRLPLGFVLTIVYLLRFMVTLEPRSCRALFPYYCGDFELKYKHEIYWEHWSEKGYARNVSFSSAFPTQFHGWTENVFRTESFSPRSIFAKKTSSHFP